LSAATELQANEQRSCVLTVFWQRKHLAQCLRLSPLM
jgi:hypothetical protein